MTADLLTEARRQANAGRFGEMLAACRQLSECHASDAGWQLSIGALLLDFGYLGLARACFERAAGLAPDDPAAWINLANVAMEAGEFEEKRRIYSMALARWPNLATLHRNHLNSLAYDPDVADAEALAAARAWGAKALGRTRGLLPRPPLQPLAGRRLRIGYVSADFCNHTVGHFVREVLKAHDRSRLEVFAYAQLRQDDAVTGEIRAATRFVDVSGLDPQAFAERVRADGIDVLVDLSGHTGGSRLLSFAYRPAPVMVSWLGYYATTGLPAMDAVLLDAWHAPPGTESQFVERIVRLPRGRFCFSPHDWMPEVAPPPYRRNGYITFGCFNNTAKLNPGVFDAWAEILREVPDSRLVLKWRTFQDDSLREAVTRAFVGRGVDASRIELRGASFHKAMLAEYGDIDIALDPFPFTGGLTSCEALWMGVPVVTWPQSRVVSRQTFAYLSAIGLPGLSAGNAGEYVRIAVDLAADRRCLEEWRAGLRERMRASALCDVAGFTASLEQAFFELHETIAMEAATERSDTMSNEQTVRIDGVEHALASLSETARANLAMLQQTEQEIQRLELQLAIARTARNAYANSLKAALSA